MTASQENKKIWLINGEEHQVSEAVYEHLQKLTSHSTENTQLVHYKDTIDNAIRSFANDSELGAFVRKKRRLLTNF
jgi:superfamily I DNA/RNA helicase